MIISSRTPEGEPNRCSVCDTEVRLDPSQPLGDAPCSNCGHLLWFPDNSVVVVSGISPADADILLRMETQRRPSKLVLDLRGVGHLTSAMIGKLVVLNKAMSARGGDLVFCNVSSNIYEVFKIMKLHHWFNIS